MDPPPLTPNHPPHREHARLHRHVNVKRLPPAPPQAQRVSAHERAPDAIRVQQAEDVVARGCKVIWRCARRCFLELVEGVDVVGVVVVDDVGVVDANHDVPEL